MPGTTRTFSYTIMTAPERVAKVEAQAHRILGWACDGDRRVTCHGVTGSPLGAVTLNLTIHGRDRWWATQLAQDILNYVVWGLEHDTTRLDLQSTAVEPHQNRGYAHGRQKTNRTSE